MKIFYGDGSIFGCKDGRSEKGKSEKGEKGIEDRHFEVKCEELNVKMFLTTIILKGALKTGDVVQKELDCGDVESV